MENGLHGRLYILKVAGSCAQFPSSMIHHTYEVRQKQSNLTGFF